MNNILDLNIKAFDSNVNILVDGDKFTIKLDSNSRFKINFDNDNNEITLSKLESVLKTNVVKTRGKPKKVNAFISEEPKEEIVEKPKEEPKVKEPDTYWENGVLKHKSENPTLVEEKEEPNIPSDIELEKCSRCGKVTKLTNIKLNNENVCKECADEVRDEIKSRVIVNKIMRTRGEDFLYE